MLHPLWPVGVLFIWNLTLGQRKISLNLLKVVQGFYFKLGKVQIHKSPCERWVNLPSGYTRKVQSIGVRNAYLLKLFIVDLFRECWWSHSWICQRWPITVGIRACLDRLQLSHAAHNLLGILQWGRNRRGLCQVARAFVPWSLQIIQK